MTILLTYDAHTIRSDPLEQTDMPVALCIHSWAVTTTLNFGIPLLPWYGSPGSLQPASSRAPAASALPVSVRCL